MPFASWRRAASVALLLIGVASGLRRTTKPSGAVGGTSLALVCRAALALLALTVWCISCYKVLSRRSKVAEGGSRVEVFLCWGARVQWLPLTIFALGLGRYFYLQNASCTQCKNAFRLGTVHCDDQGEVSDVFSVTVPASALASATPGVLPGGVPKIIHQTGPSTVVHPMHLKWLKSWKEQNPGWLHVFWTDADIRKFMAKEHPSALEQFDSYPLSVMRIDMFRTYVLYSYGGVYLDVDYEALAPLDPVLKDCGLCLVESPFKWNEVVQNSLMVSPPRHEFWRTMFDMMRQRYETMPPLACASMTPAAFCNVLAWTGPGLLSDALTAYDGAHKHANATAIPQGTAVVKTMPGGETLPRSNKSIAEIQWDIQRVADHAKVFTLKNGESGLYLNATDAKSQRTNRRGTSTSDSQWEIQPSGNGSYTLKNVGSGAYLKAGNGFTQGSNITEWDIQPNAARILPSDPFMFGKAFANGQPGVAAHRYDDSWLVEIRRQEQQFKVAMCCSACAISLALWLALNSFIERRLVSDASSDDAENALGQHCVSG